MKIELFFRFEKKGSVESKGDIVEIIGGSEVREIVGFYQRTTGLKGNELVNHMYQRMRGLWWAKASDAKLSIDPPTSYSELR